MTTTTPLAAGFDAVSLAQWRALVDKALKGADFDKRLVARLPDGLAIKPLYTRAGARPESSPPGAAPFTRGTHATVEGFGWHILSLIDAGDATSANRAVLADLEGGSNGILLTCQAPGQSGVHLSSSSEAAALLSGVHLDYAQIELDAGLAAPAISSRLLDALPALDGTPGKRHLSFNLDPLGCLARYGSAGEPISTALAHAIALAKEIRAAEPSARTLLINAALYHEAGASESQEAALLAATLTAYLRVFESAGVPPPQALSQINVRLAVDTDIFLSAAKLRAARTLIARIAAACGAPGTAAYVRITAITSARMMAKRDPWTNMLRVTAATAASAFGSADALVVLPYTHALGSSDAFARRIARNTQIVAQEESHLGRVVDPAGGSWYVEQATNDIATAAWALFQEIESAGGLVSALTSGLIQDRIAAVASVRAKSIATGRTELTGISAFPLLGPDGVTVTPRATAPPITHATEARPLAPIRLAAAFEALRDAADAAPKPPAVFLASLGEIADHTTRSTWVRNFLASGGIAAQTTDGYASPEAAASAFTSSGSRVAVIASSDALYAAQAQATARALKAAGATHIALAGRPGDSEPALKAAGIDRFLYAGQDAIQTLNELQALMAASA